MITLILISILAIASNVTAYLSIEKSKRKSTEGTIILVFIIVIIIATIYKGYCDKSDSDGTTKFQSSLTKSTDSLSLQNDTLLSKNDTLLSENSMLKNKIDSVSKKLDSSLFFLSFLYAKGLEKDSHNHPKYTPTFIQFINNNYTINNITPPIADARVLSESDIDTLKTIPKGYPVEIIYDASKKETINYKNKIEKELKSLGHKVTASNTNMIQMSEDNRQFVLHVDTAYGKSGSVMIYDIPN